MFSAETVGKLEALGFGAADCARALDATGGRLDDAACWLTQNAKPRSLGTGAATGVTALSSQNNAEQTRQKDGFQISGFEVLALCNLCLLNASAQNRASCHTAHVCAYFVDRKFHKKFRIYVNCSGFIVTNLSCR